MNTQWKDFEKMKFLRKTRLFSNFHPLHQNILQKNQMNFDQNFYCLKDFQSERQIIPLAISSKGRYALK